MTLDKYDYITNALFLDYEFCSMGPKGRIRKIVRYTLRFSKENIPFYNLGFGDWNEEKQQIDDFIISNNEDKEKVLATVASTLIDFFEEYPDAYVYAEGSTPSRTRLYQMGINKYWHQIDPFFAVFGLKDDGWHPFQNGVVYQAFMVIKKRSNFTE